MKKEREPRNEIKIKEKESNKIKKQRKRNKE